MTTASEPQKATAELAPKEKATAEELASRLACAVFEKELNLRKAFANIDTKGTGTLDRDEFANAFKDFGCPPDEAAVVFDLFDKDGTLRKLRDKPRSRHRPHLAQRVHRGAPFYYHRHL